VRQDHTIKNILHSLENDGIVAHPKIIISAPNFNLILDAAGMSDGEFGCETIDVIEIAVRFVLVLLVELTDVKLLIVKASMVL